MVALGGGCLVAQSLGRGQRCAPPSAFLEFVHSGKVQASRVDVQ
jgi:hypothetical protein